MLARPQYSPIGIDLDGRCIRAVQLRRAGGSGGGGGGSAAGPGAGWVLGAAAVLARGEPAESISPEQAGVVMAALDRQGFRGDRVVLAMPARRLLTAVLEVPPRSSGAPLDTICRNELARTHRLEPDVIESAWWEVPTSSVSARGVEGMQAMAVGCRQADAEVLIAAFDGAGAQTSAIDTRGAALARAIARCRPGASSLAAVVEWDWDAACVVVVRGETIVYERHLAESGLGACRSNLAEKLGIEPDVAGFLLESVALGDAPADMHDDADLTDAAKWAIGEWIDAIAAEARASFAYATRRFGESLPQVFACGDGAHLPGVAARFGVQLECTVTVAGASTLLPGSAESQEAARSASLAVAIGLAAYPSEALA